MCRRASSNKDEEHRTVWCLDGQVTRDNHQQFNEINTGRTISDSFSVTPARLEYPTSLTYYLLSIILLPCHECCLHVFVALIFPERVWLCSGRCCEWNAALKIGNC
ncbi:uncharacterized protein Bfra_005718 [Botrytis fragariae]|uniref:Uncharacterized protein n=1 Tax=Botrytis fragariae TaxID=1964551 RepID=A0A8H6ARU8_9HELO|nr:uncharacterized protein Bfra_005718 [Botrytis fragariae]KAF5872359.1 hypothetical protein Bfra_005718 [Botrytis fragariae]